MRGSVGLVLLWYCELVPAANAATTRFAVDPSSVSVRFVSTASIETVVGKTTQLRGWLQLDPQQLGTATAEFAVPLAALQTGNRLRDREMREDYLETGKFPEARFVVRRLSGATHLQSGTVAHVEAQGTFSVHGVSRPITVPVKLNSQATGHMTLEAHFPIRLSDYGIERPQFILLRLADTVQLTVRARLVANGQ